jgi:hypothetical protein
MNDTESQMPAQGQELEWQVAALQRQVFLLLLALIVVTFTVVFYLFYQSHILTNDLDTYRPGALQMIQTYNANARAIGNFESEVSNYGATHPAFQPVLKKYGLMPAATPSK